MPELPEVETVRRGLAPHVEGKRIVQVRRSRKTLRRPWPRGLKAALEGARILSLTRRAKFLLWRLSSGQTLISHLGMSGRFTVLPPEGATAQALGEFYFQPAAGRKKGPHDHLILDLQDGTRIIYTDPRRFGLFDLIATEREQEHPMLAHLGPEPLGNAFSATGLARRIAGRIAPIKTVLLDQTVVAGLGNIYVCEALFRARISPLCPAGALAPDGMASPALERLVAAIRDVLTEAIAAGGATLRDHQRVSGESGAFQQHFTVYGREGEPCERCGHPIQRMVQSGRSTFFCPVCQGEEAKARPS